jgi:ribosome biogenesis protein MAK21
MQATMPKETGDSDVMDDSNSDELVSVDDAALDAALSEAETEIHEEHEEHSDALAESSDNDDLLDLDDDLPEGLIEYDGSDTRNSPEEEWAGFGGGKRKRDEKKDHGGRKKLRSLPTFASYEDYANMIDEGPEDNI